MKKKTQMTMRTERNEINLEQLPICDRHPDCQAWVAGRCRALSETHYGNRECPFYKNKSENQRGQMKSLERLVQNGRTDLLDKYQNELQKNSVFELEDDYMDEMADELKEFDEGYMRKALTEGQYEWEEDEWDG